MHISFASSDLKGSSEEEVEEIRGSSSYTGQSGGLVVELEHGIRESEVKAGPKLPFALFTQVTVRRN